MHQLLDNFLLLGDQGLVVEGGQGCFLGGLDPHDFVRQTMALCIHNSICFVMLLIFLYFFGVNYGVDLTKKFVFGLEIS